LPDDHRAGLNERQRGLPAGPKPGQPGPQETIGRAEPRARDSLGIDRYLMPQCEVFQAQGCA
jgi:hypothetical protein